MRRLAAIAGLVLVAIAAAQLVRGGGDTQTFAVEVEEQPRADAGDAVGDVRVFSAALLEDGDRAGRLDGECRITDLDPEPRERCAMTATIGDGDQELQLAGVRRVAADDVVLSVTGGSGDYADARGDGVLRGERLELALED